MRLEDWWFSNGVLNHLFKIFFFFLLSTILSMTFLLLPPVQCYEPPSTVLQVLCLPYLIFLIYSTPRLHYHKEFDLVIPEWPCDFLNFLQFKSEFDNNKLMIWATISWLYRAFPFLTAKNIISLIYLLTIWWCPCVESSLVLLEKSVCYSWCILLTKSLVFALLHFVLQGQTCLLLQVSLDFLLLHSSPLWWKGHLFFGVSCSRL